MQTIQKPGMPLPYLMEVGPARICVRDANDDLVALVQALDDNDAGIDCGVKTAEYLMHAANSYPKMVELLKRAAFVLDADGSPSMAAKIEQFLRSIGEADEGSQCSKCGVVDETENDNYPYCCEPSLDADELI